MDSVSHHNLEVRNPPTYSAVAARRWAGDVLPGPFHSPGVQSTRMAASSDKVARAYARLVGLKESLPKQDLIPERFVEEYHEALQHLSDLSIDIAEFKVRPEDLERIWEGSDSRQSFYSKERYVSRALLLTKLTAVLTYFSLPDSSRGPERQIGFKAP